MLKIHHAQDGRVSYQRLRKLKESSSSPLNPCQNMYSKSNGYRRQSHSAASTHQQGYRQHVCEDRVGIPWVNLPVISL